MTAPSLSTAPPAADRQALPPWLSSPLFMPLCGILLGVSAPGYSLWMLAWLALIPALLWVRRQSTLKAVFQGGFGLGFLYHGLFCLWFFDLHPLTWLGFSDWGSRLVTLGGWLIITVEGGLLGGMLMVAYKALKPEWAKLLLFPLLWVLGFSMLNWTPLALPWAMLEYTQSALWPIRLLAGWISGSGIAAVIVSYNALWACLFFRACHPRPRWLWTTPLLVPLLIVGLQTLPQPLPAEHWPLPVVVVQANLPIEVIRSASLNAATIDPAYVQPVREANLSPGTLVVYPEEGIIPGIVRLEAPWRNPLMQTLKALADDKNLYMAVGASAVQADQPPYNATILITPRRNDVQAYFKRRLVPFGEYTPYGFGPALSNLLATLNIDYSAPYAPGRQGTLLHAGSARIGALICFELIDAAPVTGGFAQSYRKQGAQLLINTSNLGWFHQNPLMEAQFLAIGQMRAAETHLPLVIASNTGTSAIIAADGRILAQTDPATLARRHSQVILYAQK